MSAPTLPDLRRRIDARGGLPVFSSSVRRLLELVQADAEMKSIAREVERDPAIAGRVLKIANSAFYGLSRQVSSLDLAVVMLGQRNLRNIVLGIGFMQMMQDTEEAGVYPGPGFRRHSSICGRVSRVLGVGDHQVHGEDFVAGLIHDIGKLLILRAYPEQVVAHSERLAGVSGRDLMAVEQELFEHDHCVVGAWAAEEWKLPGAIVEAIASHHSTEEGTALGSLVAAADRATHWLEAHPEALALPEEWTDDPWLGSSRVSIEQLRACE